MLTIVQICLLGCICIFPILCVFISGKVFPTDHTSYTRPSFQPPGWVFSVVWSYITASLGIVTALAVYGAFQRKSVFFATLLSITCMLIVSMWCAWSAAFSNTDATSKIWSLCFLIASGIFFTIHMLIVAYQDSWTRHAVWALIPAVCWLLLASALNGTIVQEFTYHENIKKNMY